MERHSYTAFRSASLPVAGEKTRLAPLTPPARKNSSMLTSGGPITPPMSPTLTDEDNDNIIIDPEPRYSGQRTSSSAHIIPSAQPEHLLRRPSRGVEAEQHMDIDEAQEISIPRPPARNLDDEKSHVHRGSLKLTDFEVKGTLGSSWYHNTLLSFTYLYSRYWYLWSSTSCTLAFCKFEVAELLRYESPQKV